MTCVMCGHAHAAHQENGGCFAKIERWPGQPHSSYYCPCTKYKPRREAGERKRSDA